MPASRAGHRITARRKPRFGVIHALQEAEHPANMDAPSPSCELKSFHA